MTAPTDLPADEAFATLYTALRRIAAQRLNSDRQRGEVDATDLVHECYLRLRDVPEHPKLPRAELLAVCATIIRNVLVDRAREAKSRKRGGDWRRVDLSASLPESPRSSIDVLDLDAAITKLAQLDARQARIAELRIFGGLALDEIARLLSLSPRTVDGDWAMVRARLKGEVKDNA